MSWEDMLKSNGLGQQVANLEEAELWLEFLVQKSTTMRKILLESDLRYWGVLNFFELADDNLVINALRAGIKEYEDSHPAIKNRSSSQEKNWRIKQLLEFLEESKRIIGDGQ